MKEMSYVSYVDVYSPNSSEDELPLSKFVRGSLNAEDYVLVEISGKKININIISRLL